MHVRAPESRCVKLPKIVARRLGYRWRRGREYNCLPIPEVRNRPSRAGSAGLLEASAAIEPGQIPVEGSERDVSALAGDLQNEDVREG